MLLEKSGEIASEKNEQMEPKKNNTQLWMWLVRDIKFDAVKNSIAQEPGMLGHESR